jgi:hypothetical protein
VGGGGANKKGKEIGDIFLWEHLAIGHGLGPT